MNSVGAYVTMNKYFAQVERDIKRAEKERRRKAAKVVLARLKSKISDEYFDGYHSGPGEPPGKITGELKKAAGAFTGKTASLVGYKVTPELAARKVNIPAALELGSHKTGERHKKSGASTGVLAPRPSVGPAFRETTSTVKAILSDRWID